MKGDLGKEGEGELFGRGSFEKVAALLDGYEYNEMNVIIKNLHNRKTKKLRYEWRAKKSIRETSSR